MHAHPPLRTTHVTASPKNLLVYDRWGQFGRPVVLLHGLLFDRTMWWPVAAELVKDCTVIAPDLPGHGDSPARADYSLTRISWDLAALVHSLNLHRAPIIVGHGTSAWLATAFADTYETRHMMTVDEPDEMPRTVEDLITKAHPDHVRDAFRPLAQPCRDPALLANYHSWFAAPPARRKARVRLTVTGTSGGSLGCFAHLNDPAEFAAGIRSHL